MGINAIIAAGFGAGIFVAVIALTLMASYSASTAALREV